MRNKYQSQEQHDHFECGEETMLGELSETKSTKPSNKDKVRNEDEKLKSDIRCAMGVMFMNDYGMEKGFEVYKKWRREIDL